MRQKGTMRSCSKYATEVIDVYYALTRGEGDVLNPQCIGGYKNKYHISQSWPIKCNFWQIINIKAHNFAKIFVYIKYLYYFCTR
jgi:hypothetical protein